MIPSFPPLCLFHALQNYPLSKPPEMAPWPKPPKPPKVTPWSKVALWPVTPWSKPPKPKVAPWPVTLWSKVAVQYRCGFASRHANTCDGMASSLIFLDSAWFLCYGMHRVRLLRVCTEYDF